MKRNRIAIAAVSALAVLAGGTAAGAAVLAGPIDGAGVIHACYYPATSSGSHRVVLQNAGRRCPSGSTGISWNRVGRTGAQGAQGLQGPQGPQGEQGLQGPPGILHTYTYVRDFAEGTGPQIAPLGSSFQPVGSLSLPFGTYIVEATLDLEDTASFFGSNNSRVISCVLSPDPESGHLFINGADTNAHWGTLTMVDTIGGTTGVSFNCGALTGGTDQSHVLVLSVRINAIPVDTVTSQ